MKLMTLQDDIQLALTTWYPEDHNLHYDLNHPTMKLAGEAGELLDLYAKHEYKPKFDWWQCKCGHKEHSGACGVHTFTWTSESGKEHFDSYCNCQTYISLVLDELGDWWYYWRILAYITGVIEYPPIKKGVDRSYDYLLCSLNYSSALLQKGYFDCGKILSHELNNTFTCFGILVQELGVSIDEITQLNYQKLNSEETNHGWKGA